MKNKSAKALWGDFLDQHLEYAFDKEPQVDHFGDSEAVANSCLDLVLKGKKRATEEELGAAEEFFHGRASRLGVPADIAAAFADSRRASSREKPSYRAARKTEHFVAVWEQEPPEFGDGPATLHLFSPSGVYLAQLKFPDVWVDFDVVGWRLAALVRHPETGLVAVSTYEIALPAAALVESASLLTAGQAY